MAGEPLEVGVAVRERLARPPPNSLRLPVLLLWEVAAVVVVVVEVEALLLLLLLPLLLLALPLPAVVLLW